MRQAWGVLLVGVAAITAIVPGSTSAEAGSSPETGRSFRANQVAPNKLRPGDRVEDVKIGAHVPERGMGVYAEALTVTGAQELEIIHHANGDIELVHVGEETSADDEVTGGGNPGPDEYLDSAFNDQDRKWTQSVPWYFNVGSRPSNLSSTEATGAVRQGGINITQVNNLCGRGDNVSAALDYGGTTSRMTDMDASGNCDFVRDDVSVVDFGDLPSGTLATNCNFFLTNFNGYDTIVESDITLNKFDHSWTTTPTSSSCSNRWDVESVMTHERGHTFGLGHVSESTHGSLTMSSAINRACGTNERTLGKGDWLGLENKY